MGARRVAGAIPVTHGGGQGCSKSVRGKVATSRDAAKRTMDC